MLKLKIYKYDSTQEANDYRGEDFSQYLLQPPEITEDITQELDVGEITLVGLPFQEEFVPETKFVIDIVEQSENSEILLDPSPLNFCVARDMVEKSILSDNSYYVHHISLIEPSVVAQKRLVDNISSTYKLKDVVLEEQAAYPVVSLSLDIPDSYFVPPTYNDRKIGNSNNFGTISSYIEMPIGLTDAYRTTMGKYFRKEGELKILDRANNEYSVVYSNISDFLVGTNEYVAKFKIPKIEIIKGLGGTNKWSTYELDGIRFLDPMYASLDYRIDEYDLINPNQTRLVYSGSFISNSKLGYSTEGYESSFKVNFYGASETEILQREWFLEDLVFNYNTEEIDFYYKKYTDTTQQNAPTYITPEININPNCGYIITVSLHEFTDNLPAVYNNTRRYKYSGSSLLKHFTGTYWDNGQNNTQNRYTGNWYYDPPQKLTFNSSATTASTTAVFYTTMVPTSIVFSSATPYSALTLLQKAIMNCGLYEKTEGVYVSDVNLSNTPFIIDPAYIDKLSGTQVIENFYNQKNLWEIMVEVGHYIHAIPELKFGSDDKFLITFNELGRTDQKTDVSTKMSIFNSRSVEDYISATSSYVTNMVQLGGTIEEWLAPKTTNEQLLIYNDTAEIITTKPIIELLQVIVRNNLTLATADLTPYLYEENVYKTLKVDYRIVPNRGIAMYYKLGTNKITGGDYRLPQANNNIYSDYTFKKIIWCAFNGGYYIPPAGSPIPETGFWTDIKVNDYSFFVKYRTKDSVRQNHIRPDIRKYLLNSKYDRIPEHNQFNNQQDVVVDSVKFGNNVYGNLIKTGNSNIIESEWNVNTQNIKHKGELYKINGELYYVAKVTHRYYATYVESEVTYSKDYNELSQVIGIPSEPRFYEIGEQSLIWREVAINDILFLTDNKDSAGETLQQLSYRKNYMLDYSHLKDLILSTGTGFAKYALSVYKGDVDTPQYYRSAGEADFYKEVLNPINAYSSENTLTYEWDMIDNYSAGDMVTDTNDDRVNADAYKSLLAVGYTDIYGKSALFDFFIIEDIDNLSADEIRALPESPITTKENDGTSRDFIADFDILATNISEPDTNYNGRGIVLIKDCREALSINYNLQLATNSDTFVISPFVFSPNKPSVSVVLLANEVNKLSDGYIDKNEIITPLDLNGQAMSQTFTFTPTTTTQTSSWNASKTITTQFGIDLETLLSNVNPNHFTNTEGYQRVKSIVVVCQDVVGSESEDPSVPNKLQFVLARNIPDNWGKARAISSWYFGAPLKDNIFKNKQ